MAGEWAPISLGDVCTKIGSGATPRGGSDVYLSIGPYALIRSQNVYNDGFNHDGLAYVGEQHAAELSNVEVLKGDVLLNITGDSVARACQVDPRILPARVNQHVAIIRPDPSKLDPRFLRYFLVSPDMQTKLLSWAGSGGTRNALTKGMIESFEVEAPTNIDEQRAIAHILGTLDEKIELNRRMSETLEAMARALFKSWFVDFDPVRAKAEGRDPDLPQPLADLFPARLVDSELGEIPEGWEVKVLDDLSGVVLGGDWGGNEPSPEQTERTRCIRGADIPDLQTGGLGKMPARYLKPSSLEKRGLSDGDLVIEISGGSPTQSTGRPVLVSERLLRRLDAPLVCSNFCRLLKPKKRAYSKFVYLWLRTLYAADEFLQFENGTTGIKNFAFTLFSSQYKLCVPPDDVLAAFDEQVAPAFSRHQSTAAAADSLAALRDALLPKLISGELRVEDSEKFIAEVTA